MSQKLHEATQTAVHGLRNALVGPTHDINRSGFALLDKDDIDRLHNLVDALAKAAKEHDLLINDYKRDTEETDPWE